MVKVPSLAAPQLAPCASCSGRALRPRAARHSKGEAQPLRPQPRPQVLERAASKVADFTAFEFRRSLSWFTFDHEAYLCYKVT